MQTTQKDIALVWFRNNLRVQDNTVLNTAIHNHKSVIACYCFNPKHFQMSEFGFKKTEKFRTQFLIETLIDLKANLNALNIELFVSVKFTINTLKDLVETFNIKSIYLENEWTSEEIQVLNDVKESLPNDVVLNQFFDQFLYLSLIHI